MEIYACELKQFLISSGYLENGEDVGNDESLFESGVIDSLAVIEITEFIKTKYDFSVPEEDLVPENFDSIDAMATYLSKAKD